MKIKIISLMICILFLTCIFPGLTTAKNLINIDTSVANSNVDLRDGLIKIFNESLPCDMNNDFVIWAWPYLVSNYLYFYDIQTGETDTVYVGGNIVYPKISENRVVYYDFEYMGFKMYNISTGEITDLIVTNWEVAESDGFQLFGDYLVYENFYPDLYSTEIYLYNIATSENIQLTDSPGEDYSENPCIYENVVAWQLNEGNIADIVMYNIDSTEYTRVTNTSQFASETFPSIYENDIVYSYLYYDKVNGTLLYGLKMYDIGTGDETTLFTEGEPTGSTPEIFGDIIAFCKPGVSLSLYDLRTNLNTTIYEGDTLSTPWDLNEWYIVLSIGRGWDGIYLYKYNNPPTIEITIKGGLGVSATITNMGTTNLTNISWNIALDGKLIFIGKDKSGTIDSLAAGESKTVRDFALGFGKTGILVTTGSTTQNATGTVILFFVIGVE